MKKVSLIESNRNTPLQNRIRVLQLIRNNGDIFRGDIISKTGLSAPTVTRIVEELFEKKLIKQEDSGESSGGRPPQIIRFDSKNNYVIGIDIGGSFIRAAFSNLDGEFIYEIHMPTDIKIGFDGIMEQVGELIKKLLDRASSKKERIFGIGIAVCGIMNKNSKVVDYSPVLNWKNVDVGKALSKYTDLKISVRNVANLIAQGELFFGAGKKYDSFISINLDYGIGSGIIIDGELFYGSGGYSGEIGHIVVDHKNSIKGREGIKGTLEALASGYGIVEIIKDRIAGGEPSVLAKKLDSINSKKILEAAIQGDKLSIEILNNTTEYIGVSIDTLIKLFNPEAILLSGGLSSNKEYFVDRIREKVSSLTLPILNSEVPILQSTFGEEAALMGAFSLMLESILKLE
tara:strand:+ start:25263 stop:26468 length:1206 start_codon:yes stop_codon:yes gene_type:complete